MKTRKLKDCDGIVKSVPLLAEPAISHPYHKIGQFADILEIICKTAKLVISRL